MINGLKKELYNQLRNLFFEVIHKDKDSFLKVKVVYNSLLKEIFGKTKFNKNEECFYWVEVRDDLERYLNGAGNNLEEIGDKIKSLKRFFEKYKNNDLRSKKEQLFKEFEKLYQLAEEGKREEYDNLNRDCSEKVTEIFGFSLNEEGHKWDLTKNMILGVFQARARNNKELLRYYKKEFKKKKKEIEKYLK